jgi:hypothetical protein
MYLCASVVDFAFLSETTDAHRYTQMFSGHPLIPRPGRSSV